MENLTKTQLILLALLVSFFTSLVTGIVAVTLMNQAPPPLTQTVSKIIEKVVQPSAPSQTPSTAPALAIISQENQIVKIVKDVSSAVVSVIATKDLPVIEQYFVTPFEDEFFQRFIPPELLPYFQAPQYRQKGTEKRQIASGTGFFISSDGFLATNKHVVEDTGAEYWIIMNDGRKFKAEVLARDPIQDVAVLKAETPKTGDYNFIPLGDSDKLNVGQTVIAIGNALGEFQNTVSVGVISGLNRTLVASGNRGSEVLQEVIQTDAAINPGNSGGPMIGLSGEAIGINTAMAQAAENIGFALPINFIKKALADIKEFGKIQYAYLGIRYLIINNQIKEEKKLSVDYGALIAKGPNGEQAVMENSPAQKAGLKEGDIILEFGGIRITQNTTLASLINRRRAGEIIALKVLRDGKELTLSVTLATRPENI
jgi:serine protease Do